jgi:hypothetical protein
MLSCLVAESYLLTAFLLWTLLQLQISSGACLLVMALEACNAFTSLDAYEVTAALAALLLDSFPGENIAGMMNKALCIVKVMRTEFMILNNTGL